MTLATPVAVTGAHGRLGRAVVDALAMRGIEAIAWSRPDYDLDDAQAAQRVIERDRPALVVHPAAWTDVDGCARNPQLAIRRNATAVGELADAAASNGIDLLLVSTNEVFDGYRVDGRGYGEDDPVNPINAYGMSKLKGEEMAREAFAQAGRDDRLWIVRTAWLYGPPGNDFPAKIIAAADRLPAGEPLKVVADETGSPTYTRDLAAGMLDLAHSLPGGLYHLAGAGHASRFDVASSVLGRCRPGVSLVPISGLAFKRPSVPPAWAVLDCATAARGGIAMRPWREALADYLPLLC